MAWHGPPNTFERDRRRRAWRRAPASMLMATVFGVGHLPGGPGTYAAMLATPLIWAMSGWPLPMRLMLFILVTMLSCVWCDRAGEALDEDDSSILVIDEFVGVWCALVWFGELSWLAALVGLVAFRVFDIAKPWPCRWIDRHLHSGLGVVLDDLVAGLWSVPFVALAVWLS